MPLKHNILPSKRGTQIHHLFRGFVNSTKFSFLRSENIGCGVLSVNNLNFPSFWLHCKTSCCPPAKIYYINEQEKIAPGSLSCINAQKQSQDLSS